MKESEQDAPLCAGHVLNLHHHINDYVNMSCILPHQLPVEAMHYWCGQRGFVAYWIHAAEWLWRIESEYCKTEFESTLCLKKTFLAIMRKSIVGFS